MNTCTRDLSRGMSYPTQSIALAITSSTAFTRKRLGRSHGISTDHRPARGHGNEAKRHCPVLGVISLPCGGGPTTRHSRRLRSWHSLSAWRAAVERAACQDGFAQTCPNSQCCTPGGTSAPLKRWHPTGRSAWRAWLEGRPTKAGRPSVRTEPRSGSHLIQSTSTVCFSPSEASTTAATRPFRW